MSASLWPLPTLNVGLAFALVLMLWLAWPKMSWGPRAIGIFAATVNAYFGLSVLARPLF